MPFPDELDTVFRLSGILPASRLFHVIGVLRGFNGSAFGVTLEPHVFGIIQPLACSPLFTYQDFYRELVD